MHLEKAFENYLAIAIEETPAKVGYFDWAMDSALNLGKSFLILFGPSLALFLFKNDFSVDKFMKNWKHYVTKFIEYAFA